VEYPHSVVEDCTEDMSQLVAHNDRSIERSLCDTSCDISSVQMLDYIGDSIATYLQITFE
jgi:hypothetical protein